MKPISTKFEDRIQKNANKYIQEESSTIPQVERQPKELVHKRIEQNLKWAFENYQKTTLC